MQEALSNRQGAVSVAQVVPAGPCKGFGTAASLPGLQPPPSDATIRTLRCTLYTQCQNPNSCISSVQAA